MNNALIKLNIMTSQGNHLLKMGKRKDIIVHIKFITVGIIGTIQHHYILMFFYYLFWIYDDLVFDNSPISLLVHIQHHNSSWWLIPPLTCYLLYLLVLTGDTYYFDITLKCTMYTKLQF